MQTIFDVNYFINKFSAIPEEQWCVGELHKWECNQHCAIGHCLSYTNGFSTKESGALSMLFVTNLSNIAASINNGKDERYLQPTPKQRILAALYDIKKMQEPVIEQPVIAIQPETKVVHVYHSVEVDRAIKEQSEGLLMN